MPQAAHRERLVVVGNGMAGLRLLEELEAACPGRYATTIVGAEPEPAYNRVLLSSLLAGEIGAADIVMRPRAWYEERGIALVTGVAATGVAAGGLALSDGRVLAFDKLVLATGAEPVVLPLAGRELAGVTTFRTCADVARMQAIAPGTAVAVIGGGLLGIEAAYGLARAGLGVTLVHVMDRLMERQLDAQGAALLAAALEGRGITVRLATQTRAICGDGKVEAIETDTGERIPCALVAMAVGVRPATGLAAMAGAAVGRGIVVDDAMRTSVPGVFALGDCAEHRGLCYGLVEPAYAQARVLASVLAGKPAAYPGSVLATNLKVSGVPVFSAGDFEGRGGEPVVLRDESAPSYRKLVLREGRLVGAVLVGDTRDAAWYADLISSGVSVARMRADLAFGRAWAEAA
ncbi:MAG: FAD-dependent oxidoreductase [Hyphomicrobiaceae bacterium]|nr:FAD-dependent oxidoreductase [Hyphomicrobiaceae bacterium]